MQTRLAFSVATWVDTDILIIDESLSVGDAGFQLKSFNRIGEFKRAAARASSWLVTASISWLASATPLFSSIAAGS